MSENFAYEYFLLIRCVCFDAVHRLRDDCSNVRKCTLMVMTRLILNDMVKVKGQISEIAACLVDKEDQIKQLAAQFFSELANKVI